MNGFNERWKECARRARRAWRAEAAAAAMPSAPVHRVREWLAAGRGPTRGADTCLELWWAYGRRGLVTGALVLAACAGLLLVGPHEPETLRPRIETSMAQAFWIP